MKHRVEKSSTFSIQYLKDSKYLSSKRSNLQIDFGFIRRMFKTFIATDEVVQ